MGGAGGGVGGKGVRCNNQKMGEYKCGHIYNLLLKAPDTVVDRQTQAAKESVYVCHNAT